VKKGKKNKASKDRYKNGKNKQVKKREKE